MSYDPNPHRWLFGDGLGPSKKPEPPKRAFYDPPSFVICVNRDCRPGDTPHRYGAHKERCPLCAAPKPVQFSSPSAWGHTPPSDASPTGRGAKHPSLHSPASASAEGPLLSSRVERPQ